MKLYSALTDKIQNTKTHTVGGTVYVLDKLSDAELNAINLHRISYGSQFDSRYYTNTETRALVLDVYAISYTQGLKLVADVKDRMLSDLRDVYEAKQLNPLVSTGLGYNVYGSRDSVDDLIDAKDNAEPTIIDADNNVQNVTGVEYGIIADVIKADRNTTRAIAKSKVAEIRAFNTIVECEYYEATPYTYTYTQEDVDNDITGTIVLGETTTRYTNNVTSWE